MSIVDSPGGGDRGVFFLWLGGVLKEEEEVFRDDSRATDSARDFLERSRANVSAIVRGEEKS